MKKINFYSFFAVSILLGLLFYVAWDEVQTNALLEKNLLKSNDSLDENTKDKADFCQFNWDSSITLFKVCLQDKKFATIKYGAQTWRITLEDTPKSIRISDGDYNLNNAPELYFIDSFNHKSSLIGYELKDHNLIKFQLPPLMGSMIQDYRGSDSLYFEKQWLVRQFDSDRGKKELYYELMPNLHFELRFSKDILPHQRK